MASFQRIEIVVLALFCLILAGRGTAADASTSRTRAVTWPVKWGTAMDAKSRIFVSLEDGRVLCFAPKQ